MRKFFKNRSPPAGFRGTRHLRRLREEIRPKLIYGWKLDFREKVTFCDFARLLLCVDAEQVLNCGFARLVSMGAKLAPWLVSMAKTSRSINGGFAE